MELFYFLFVVMPGLYLYSVLRREGFGGHENEPEYVVAIRGILGSMPFLFLIALYAGNTFPDRPLLVSLEEMALNPWYFGAYFLGILVYAHLYVAIFTLWCQKAKPWLSRRTEKLTGKHSHDPGYPNAWSDLREEYMMRKECVVGRVKHEGEVLALGQINFLSSSQKTDHKEISFVYQEDYEGYFPEDGPPLLEHLCTYVDLQTGYVIELYDGNKQVRSAADFSVLEEGVSEKC